jgi:hypothetical protein
MTRRPAKEPELHPDPNLPDPKRLDRFRAKGGTLIGMLIRENVAADRRAERQRIKQINAPVAPGPDGEDHGMDLGPASIARGGSVERVGGKLAGAGQKQAAPVYARKLDASTLFERMNDVGQLSDRQAKAGNQLWRLKRAAGVEARVTARYLVVPEKVEGADDDDETLIETVCPDGFDHRTYYRFVLRQLPSHMAHLVEKGCDWTPEMQRGHPGVRFLPTFQIALDRLAEVFGIAK